MPSLHAGAALLVVLFLWPDAGAVRRMLLASYVLLMGAVLVYTGEHYVVDVLAGWATAVAGIAVGRGVVKARKAVTPARAGARRAPGPRR
jgi:membrane-associated phospholipid phosphatase